MSRTNRGVVVGYDPGGMGAHGLAELDVESGRPVRLVTRTADSLAEALAVVENLPDVIGFGIDTLTCWATGSGGWRPGDLWLRKRYPQVARSVVSPNYLSGAMGINGMGFLLAVRSRWPEVFVTETHPKVLLFQMARTKHDYAARRGAMDQILGRALGLKVAPANDHELGCRPVGLRGSGGPQGALEAGSPPAPD